MKDEQLRTDVQKLIDSLDAEVASTGERAAMQKHVMCRHVVQGASQAAKSIASKLKIILEKHQH